MNRRQLMLIPGAALVAEQAFAQAQSMSKAVAGLSSRRDQSKEAASRQVEQDEIGNKDSQVGCQSGKVPEICRCLSRTFCGPKPAGFDDPGRCPRYLNLDPREPEACAAEPERSGA